MRIGDKVEIGAPYTDEWDHGEILSGDVCADGTVRVRWAVGQCVFWAHLDELKPFDGRQKCENDSPTGHQQGCGLLLAATGAIAIECEHGYDTCPICDPCTCASKP